MTTRVADGADAPFTRLRRFLGATASLSTTVAAPNVWLTEHGAVRTYRLPRPGGGFARRFNRLSCQARITRLLLTAPAISDRIRRFYYYSLRGDATWDTGLLNRSNSRPRPAYWVYRAKSRSDVTTAVRGRC